MNLIAFTGPAGAGKDTAAGILATYARFERLAFADTLRAEVAQAFEIEDRMDLLSDRATKESPQDALSLRNCNNFCFIGAVAVATRACVNSEWLDAPRAPRQILQWWGTEFRRAQDDRYWVKALSSRMAVMRSAGVDRFAITDCRFGNELAFVRSLQGQLWRLHRGGLSAVEGGHASAVGLHDAKADVELSNEGSTEDLRNLVLRHWWSTDSGIAPQRLRIEVLA